MINKNYKKQIKLLDCTLRDGGSVNKWDFGHQNIMSILQTLNFANIDIVEIGFLQNGYQNSYDLSISDNTKNFDEKLEQIVNKNFKAVAMIDIGKFDIEELPQKKYTYIDGIRLMFKKSELELAFQTSLKIMEKGYSLSLNPVSVTTYDERDIEQLCDKTNSLMPDILYIIDTYGLMNNEETLKYFRTFNECLDCEIEIGYHAHNNLQLAYSNSIQIINNKNNRNIVVDGSLYGMGKRAGNTPTELLAYYLNTQFDASYNLKKIDDIIEQVIMPMKNNFEWGYSLIHYIAAINGCHSDYVTYLYNEKRVPLSRISDILKLIPNDKKLIFDKTCISEINT
ncbi:hypothetical protein IJ182_02620 [bacterium]|nr:hypothetical protein [bacterium]